MHCILHGWMILTDLIKKELDSPGPPSTQTMGKPELAIMFSSCLNRLSSTAKLTHPFHCNQSFSPFSGVFCCRWESKAGCCSYFFLIMSLTAAISNQLVIISCQKSLSWSGWWFSQQWYVIYEIWRCRVSTNIVKDWSGTASNFFWCIRRALSLIACHLIHPWRCHNCLSSMVWI